MDNIIVTQADRKAACEFYGYDDEKDLAYWGNVSNHGDVERLAAAFARHRQSSIASLTGDVGAALRAESIMNAVLELPFANAAPIEWDDADWHHVRRALSALTPSPLTDAPDAVRALKWIDHNLRLAANLMETSVKAGNGRNNFAAHDAHQALTVAKNAITALTTPAAKDDAPAYLLNPESYNG